jgi:hypothetical protein
MEPYLIMPSPLILSPTVALDVEAGLLLDPLVYRHWQGDWGAVSADDARRFTAIAETCPLVGAAVTSSFRTPFGPLEITSRPEPKARTPTVTLACHPGEVWEPVLETAVRLSPDPG